MSWTQLSTKKSYKGDYIWNGMYHGFKSCFSFSSELTKYEEILLDYKRYKKLLFKLSPPEWQEAQSAKSMEATVPSGGDTLDEPNSKSEESACRNGKGFTLVQVK